MLVNRAPSSAAKLSRGLLPMNLIPSPTLSEIAEHISTTDLSDFAAFTLAAFQPSLPAALFHWDGQRLTAVLDGDRHVPLVSSSFDPERVALDGGWSELLDRHRSRLAPRSVRGDSRW